MVGYMGKEFNMLEARLYVVSDIKGDYADLQSIDGGENLDNVARALLPESIFVGAKVKCEMFQYEIID